MEKIRVFYRNEMSFEQKNGTFSPSSGKPAKLLAHLEKNAIPFELASFEPCSRADFLLSHEEEYVDGVLAGSTRNGFGNCDLRIAQTLPYTVGSMIAACRYALTSEETPVAWSFTSGFHHANYSKGGGFCTFEGLTIAAQKMLAEGLAQKVLIIDGDHHFGDGCVNVIQEKNLEGLVDYQHISGDNSYVSPIVLEKIIGDSQPDLIIFQDGMDAYQFDPLGGRLSYAELFERNRLINQIAKEKKIPLVINLAGGYLRAQAGEAEEELQPVLQGHLNAIISTILAHGLEGAGQIENKVLLQGAWESRCKSARLYA